MTDVVVAGPMRARFTGHCFRCKVTINNGDSMVKIAAPGKTTSHGQGPGKWIHEKCVVQLDESGGMTQHCKWGKHPRCQSGPPGIALSDGGRFVCDCGCHHGEIPPIGEGDLTLFDEEV